MTKEQAINIITDSRFGTSWDFAKIEWVKKNFSKNQILDAAYMTTKDYHDMICSYTIHNGYKTFFWYFLDKKYNRHYVAVNSKDPELNSEFARINRFANV